MEIKGERTLGKGKEDKLKTELKRFGKRIRHKCRNMEAQ